MSRYQATTSGANIKFQKARGTLSAPSLVSLSDEVFYFEAWAYARNSGDTSDAWVRTGRIDSNITNVDAQGRVGGGLTFWTNSSASGGITQRMRIDHQGYVGIATTSPAATLDVNGFMKLAKRTSAPVACAAGVDGAISLTSTYRLCVCKSGTGWVYTSDGASACVW